jgi:metal-responsive CopG/Arc/MetJ family transcriptional regulator
MTAKRVLISIDARLLTRVDARVQRLGLTRSGYLAQLAAADLEADRSGGPRPDLAAVDDLFDKPTT